MSFRHLYPHIVEYTATGRTTAELAAWSSTEHRVPIAPGGVASAMLPWVELGAFFKRKDVVKHEVTRGPRAGTMGGHPTWRYFPVASKVWRPEIVLQCIGSEPVAREVLAARGVELEVIPQLPARRLTPVPPRREEQPIAHDYTDEPQRLPFPDERPSAPTIQQLFTTEFTDKGVLIPFDQFPRFAQLLSLFMQQQVQAS